MESHVPKHPDSPTAPGAAPDAVAAHEPDSGHYELHIVPPALYIKIFVALLIFTGLTVGAAFIDLREFNPVIAILIACIKAVLVVLFFMHVYYSSRLMKLTVAAGFFTFLVLITMTMTDYMSRAWGLW
jgi:cytochrome c oxidase subunit 4